MISCKPHERTLKQKDYRNGYWKRCIVLKDGPCHLIEIMILYQFMSSNPGLLKFLASGNNSSVLGPVVIAQ
ncbi:MAG: hypothetical protein IBX72_06640 [Nitrospirae bacterium]|nr:hypothetical protein [Nitrospirota bacterium]